MSELSLTRDFDRDPQLWTVLDMSRASGVAHPVSDATLRGAAARARGQLTMLEAEALVAARNN